MSDLNPRILGDINHDPFLFMEDNDKVYCEPAFLSTKLARLSSELTAFTITVYEISATIPSLWGHVKSATSSIPHHFYVLSTPPSRFLERPPTICLAEQLHGLHLS